MKRLIALAAILCSVGVFSFIALPVSATDADFSNGITVDSTGDGIDANLADSTCNDGSGNCTLRAAIEEANDTPGTQEINFAIPGTGVHTISPATQLPNITSQVTINGYSESDADENTAVAPAALNGTLVIEINGTSVASYGLLFDTGSSGSSVRGLVINRFGGTGVVIGDTNITVAGNYIGTDPSGLIDRGNTGAGITNAGLEVESASAQIGGLNAADRNLISGNTDSGAYPRTDWVLQGNYIGVDATGLTAMGNSTIGASGGLSVDECSGTIIGGSDTGAANVISGNLSHGIAPHQADDIIIQGNYIGVGRDGTTAIANGGAGIVLTESANALIGGAASGEGNTVSNSGGDNIYLGLDNNGVTVQGNIIDNSTAEGVAVSFGTNITIGGAATGEGNEITDSGRDGIAINQGASNVTIRGTLVDQSGRVGINMNDADNVTIGGTQSGASNTIRDNVNQGVLAQNGTTGVSMVGNLVQTNGVQGIHIQASSNVTIGGTQTGAGNTILDNSGENILIDSAAADVIVRGNVLSGSGSENINVANSINITIGGAQAGAGNNISNSGTNGIIIDTVSSAEVNSNSVGASDYGIIIDSSPSTLVSGNTVSASTATGIQVDSSAFAQLFSNDILSGSIDGVSINSSDSVLVSYGTVNDNGQHGFSINSSDDVVVSGVTISDNTQNGIVTNGITGLVVENSTINDNGSEGIVINGDTGPIIRGSTVSGNAGAGGISMSNVTSALIGGADSSDRNVISNNGGQANIIIVGFGGVATNNTIQGNYVGTNAQGGIDGSYTHNAGIALSAAVNNTLIGGTQPGEGNVIAGNSGAGIIVAELSIDGVGDIAPANNAIVGNSIYGNVPGVANTFNIPGLGIELATMNFDGTFTPLSIDNGGPNVPQDASDTDIGPNAYMNFPVLNSVNQNDNQLRVNLDLDAADSTLNGQYRVEFFANDQADATGYGEGQTYLGAATITNGNAQTAEITLPAGTNLTGKILSATTTALTSDGDGLGATSEFSEVKDISVYISPLNGLLETTGDILKSPYIIFLAGVAVVGMRYAYTTKYKARYYRLV